MAAERSAPDSSPGSDGDLPPSYVALEPGASDLLVPGQPYIGHYLVDSSHCISFGRADSGYAKHLGYQSIGELPEIIGPATVKKMSAWFKRSKKK